MAGAKPDPPEVGKQVQTPNDPELTFSGKGGHGNTRHWMPVPGAPFGGIPPPLPLGHPVFPN